MRVCLPRISAHIMHTVSFSLIGHCAKGGDSVVMFYRFCWIDQQRHLEYKVCNTMQHGNISGDIKYLIQFK